MDSLEIKSKSLGYLRIDSDIYGNPRYYIPLTTIMQYLPDMPTVDDYIRYINKNRLSLYVYRGKKYGYGYTIQSYNVEGDLEKEISHLLESK